MVPQNYSVVEIRGCRRGYPCGYCGRDDGKSSYGMWAHILTVKDYQDLIDRGWRRSGKYCYQPIMKQTCCAQYTIRCEALAFQLSRSQKKVLKRVKHFLQTGEKPKKLRSFRVDEAGDQHRPELEMAKISASTLLPEEKQPKKSEEPGNSEMSQNTLPRDLTNTTDKKNALPEAKTRSTAQDCVNKDKGPCKKAKAIRIERALLRAKKRQESGLPPLPSKKRQNERKTIENFLNETAATAKHSLETKLVRANPDYPEFQQTMEESFAVYRKYEMSVHSKSHEGEPVTKDGWLRFLVSSPFENDEEEDDKIGAFHMQYLLDGKIIAVGVIDILPKCISAKYFYYDIDYAFLSLGTYSALREIELTRTLHQIVPSIMYYYLGFYVHTCPKMRYKAKFKPACLLCPETYTWHSIEKCLLRLDVVKYSRFANADTVDEDGQVELSKVLVLHQRQTMTYDTYVAKAGRRGVVPKQQEVQEYASLVGRVCAQRMLLYRA